MQITSWLDSVRSRLRLASMRRRPTRLRTSIENLEDRTLLSVSAFFADGELEVISDSNDSIRIRVLGADLVVEEALPGQPFTPITTLQPILAADVVSIKIEGGDGDNLIDVSQLSTGALSNINGVELLINSGNGDDTILGSMDLNDTINAGDGDDIIVTQLGDEVIDAGHGEDSVTAGFGNDIIIGGDGNDTIFGGAGDDTIDTGDGADSIEGGDGNDSITTGSGSDTILAGAGDDTVNAGSGADTILGGDGADSLLGGSSADSISGGAGADTIDGGSGGDTISGGDDDDSITGGSGDDSIVGDDGNDTLIGKSGDDTLDGAAGNDKIFAGGGNDQLFGDGSDPAQLATGDDTLFGHAGRDTLVGGFGSDVLDGGTQDDLIRSSFTADEIPDPPAPPMPPPPPPPPPGAGTLQDAVDSGVGIDSGSTVVTLTNGAGDANLIIDLNGSGEFGEFSNVPGVNAGAIYDPVGPILPAVTTFESEYYFRDNTGGATGTRGTFTALSGGGVTIRESPTEANSTFTIGGLTFALTQTLTPLNDSMGVQNGTLLTQTFVVTNLGAATVDFELVRYLDGDLDFDGSLIDGGGRLTTPLGDEILFETDAGGATTSTTFVGISGKGGTVPGANRFEIDDYLFGQHQARIAAGTALDNLIFGDGDGDGFVDPGSEYDVTLAFRNLFSLTPGASDTYSSHTLFGSGVPTDVGSNTAPTANNDFGSVFEGRSLVIDVVSNDTDSDGVPVFSTIAIVTPPLNGTAMSLGDGRIRYTPNIGFSGVDTFQYTIEDNLGAVSNVATVTITVNPADAGRDTLIGGTGDDTIVASVGDDLIFGDEGNDLIDGAGGPDMIFGGSGRDTINGGDGDDVIEGNGGDDEIDGGNGDDLSVWFGDTDDNDVYTNLSGADTVEVRGDENGDIYSVGKDSLRVLQITHDSSTITIAGTISHVILNAGDGADIINIVDLDEVAPVVLTLNGEGGRDIINGAGAQGETVLLRLNGGADEDVIIGTEGPDSIHGGDGDDTISGGGGNDTIFGEAGDDSIDGQDGNDSIMGGLDSDSIHGADGDDTLIGDSGADTLRGQRGNDLMFGNDGRDKLVGSQGNDSLDGGNNMDTLLAGSGNDVLDGGAGNDFLRGHNGNDSIHGGDGSDKIMGDQGDDTIIAGDGDDVIHADAGNDLVNGGDGDDRIFGSEGNDVLVGGDGDDTLRGGAGADTLQGNEGDDALFGLGGTDVLTGGEGDDTFDDLSEIDEDFVLSMAVMEALELI